MPSLIEEIADALALDVIRAAQELGDDNLITDIANIIGASSTTTQEAFMTAVRVRLSEQRARRTLAERLSKGPAGGARRGPGARPILDTPEDGTH